MAGYFIAPAVIALRDHVVAAFPSRGWGAPGSSDGIVGDASHQARVSDHNPCWTCSGASYGIVRAIDLDEDGWPVQDFITYMLGRCRSGAEKRVQYIINRRRIWSASWGWTERYYSGSNPHTSHVHVSMKHDSSNFQTHPWLPGFPPTQEDDSMSAAEVADLKAELARSEARIKEYARDLMPRALGSALTGSSNSVYNATSGYSATDPFGTGDWNLAGGPLAPLLPQTQAVESTEVKPGRYIVAGDPKRAQHITDGISTRWIQDQAELADLVAMGLVGPLATVSRATHDRLLLVGTDYFAPAAA